MIQDYTWEDSSDDKVHIYTCVLHLLSAMSQESYLYHIDKGSRVPSHSAALGLNFVNVFIFFYLSPLVFYLPAASSLGSC